MILVVLVIFQGLLGALTVWTGKNPFVTTAHVATGSLLLGMSLALVSCVYRLLGFPSQKRAGDLAPGRSNG